MPEKSSTPSPAPKAAGAFRPLYLVAGLVFVALGIAGYILPVMPGTVFLILAAGCFARSSPKLEHWLVTHPKLGPTVVAWRKTGAIPRPIKIIAIISMAISMTAICLSPAPVWVDWLVAAILVGSALFVGSRPSGPRAAT